MATLSGAGTQRASRERRTAAPWALAALVAGSTVVVALHDPHATGSYGACPLYALTGLWCPACGCLRATHDLAHGDLASAWSMNPLWVIAVPLLVAVWVRWVRRAHRGVRLDAPPAWLAWSVLALLAAFGVARNIPALAPWLAP